MKCHCTFFYLNCKLLKSKNLSFYSNTHSHIKGLREHLYEWSESQKRVDVSKKYLSFPLSFLASSSDFCSSFSSEPWGCSLKPQIFFLFTEARVCLLRLRDPFTCDSFGGTRFPARTSWVPNSLCNLRTWGASGKVCLNSEGRGPFTPIRLTKRPVSRPQRSHHEKVMLHWSNYWK